MLPLAVLPRAVVLVLVCVLPLAVLPLRRGAGAGAGAGGAGRGAGAGGCVLAGGVACGSGDGGWSKRAWWHGVYSLILCQSINQSISSTRYHQDRLYHHHHVR